VLVDVQIAGSALIAQAPERMPDVFAGAPIVAALALRPEGGELVVRGALARDTWAQRLRVPARRRGEGNGAFAALYARERVADLEAREVTGETYDREIEAIGLQFQIATRLTSWIAVDEQRKASGPSRTEIVPQELPYGTSAASFGLRGGGGEGWVDTFDGNLGEDPMSFRARYTMTAVAPMKKMRVGRTAAGVTEEEVWRPSAAGPFTGGAGEPAVVVSTLAGGRARRARPRRLLLLVLLLALISVPLLALIAVLFRWI
jgi:hypothetical protein